MASELIGRNDEIERLQAFLDGPPLDGPRALVLEGDAGIGKSTIWLSGLELIRDRELRVLLSRPAEAEQALAFACLGDLFEDVLDSVLSLLPPPRRRALEIALLLADEGEEPLDPRALGVAVRSALELLSEMQPLVLAVDDVQWLDGSSKDVLSFALRRTRAPIRVLLTRRLDPTTVESSFLSRSIEHLHIGPLSAGALQGVIRERLSRVLPRPTLLRICDMSGGNPFYALEIARALPENLDPTQPLPVPETMDELLRARIDALPDASQRALVVLAAMGEGKAEILRKSSTEDALEIAITHGIVVRAEDRLRFTHPLLASTVYQGADAATRRSSHAALAKVVRDPLQKARHLALAAGGPDLEIARSLDEAAIAASIRGAPHVAGELSELARRLTPDDDHEGRHRRAILGATAHIRAGDLQRARLLAEEAASEATDDRSRAEALVLSSAVEAARGNLDLALALRREALSEAVSHHALQAAIHQWLAIWDSEGIEAKERHAATALDLADQLDDDFLRAGALTMLATLRFQAGEPDAVELAEQAHALAARATRDGRGGTRTDLAHVLAWTYDRLDMVASFALADILSDIGRFDQARKLLDGLERKLAGRDELLHSKILCVSSMLELEAGRWSLAHELIEREGELVAMYEHAPRWPGPLIVRAELALHWGKLDRALELAVKAHEFAVESRTDLANAEAVLGVVKRAARDSAAAIAHFAVAERVAEESGWREPTILWWRAEFAEELLESGQPDEAARLLDAWEQDARRLGRDRVLAQVTRCRGLVAAARGDIDLALTALGRAVDEADAVTDPFGRARALLALGVMRRRARQRRDARTAIAAALAEFEALGEVTWAKRAQAELGRIGGRKREEGLTAAERRVAALVAEGRTNREVAATLFLGERTVETHLSRIYAKLGIRSRTELARAYESLS